MANWEIVDYIKKYKDSYPEESIRTQLVNSGYSESEINEAFGENSTMKTNNSSPDSQSTNLEKLQYAGFWTRTVAYTTDVVIYLFIIFLSYIISIVIGVSSMSLLGGDLSTISNISILPPILAFLMYVAYEILMVKKFGATLGKMAIGAKIVKVNGDEMDMSSSIIRFLVKYFLMLFSIILWFLLSLLIYLVIGFTIIMYFLTSILAPLISHLIYLVVAFTEKKRGIHDMIAKTYVIYSRGVCKSDGSL